MSVADRDHRPLQPAMPNLLRQQRAGPPAVQDARAHPAAHRRRRAQRGRAGRRADLGRGADHPPAVLRGARLRQGRADPPPDGEHQRHPHRARRSLCRAPRPLHAGLRGVPAVRLARRGAADPAARRRSARRAHARARAAERARDLHDAGGDAEEGPQRPRDRPHHRLRARTTRGARRDVPADPGGRPAPRASIPRPTASR